METMITQRRNNKVRRTLLTVPMVLATLWGLTGPAHAIPIEAVTVSGGIVTNPINPTVVGWNFTANQNIDVVALGAWDFTGDGFSGTIDVGLWDILGNLLATATLTGTNQPLASSGFRYATIGPVSLTTGSEYVIASTGGPSNQYLRNAIVSDSPGVTWGESRGENSASLVFPTSFTANVQGYFGGNFQYQQTVPAPATVILFGIALIGLGWSRRNFVAA